MSNEHNNPNQNAEPQDFHYWVYERYSDNEGLSARSENFKDFAETVEKLRAYRPIVPATGVDDKRSGPLIGLPKADPNAPRGKGNHKTASWGCIDLDGVSPGFIEAISAVFPKYRCAVWRSHSWTATDPRTKVLFAMSRTPDCLEDWSATVLAFYDVLNKAAEACGLGMPLKDKSCASPTQMQVTVPAGRKIRVYEGAPFPPVKAPVESQGAPVACVLPPVNAVRMEEDRYAQCVFEREIEYLSSIPEGGGANAGRNNALNITGCKLFGFVAAGRLRDSDVEAALIRACELNGLAKDKENGGRAGVMATIRSARRKGMQSPNYKGMEQTRPVSRAQGNDGFIPPDLDVPDLGDIDIPDIDIADAPDLGNIDLPDLDVSDLPDLDVSDLPEIELPELNETPGPKVESKPRDSSSLGKGKNARKPFRSMGLLMDEINERRGREMKRISTGIPAVDHVLGGGIREKGLYLFGARSSLGKTAFCQQIAENIAERNPVLFYTIEMDKSELLARSYTRLARHHALRVDGKPLNNSQVEDILAKDPQDPRLEKVRQRILQYAHNLHFRECEDFGGTDALPTVESIIEDVRAFKSENENRLPVVFIDYLQLLKNREDRPTTDAYARLSLVSRKLKNLGTLCPVIVVSSISRSSYFDTPSLDSFKGCGEIEYSANVAMILSPGTFSYDDDKSEKQNRVEWNRVRALEEKVLALDVVKGRSISQPRCYLRYAGRSYYYEALSDQEAAEFEAFQYKPVQNASPVKRVGKSASAGKSPVNMSFSEEDTRQKLYEKLGM